MGLVRDELLFTFAVAGRLGSDAEFLYFQHRTDTHELLRANHARFWTPAGRTFRDHGMDDAELLFACGMHERYWSPDLGALRRRAHVLAGAITEFLIVQSIDCVIVWSGVTLVRSLSAHIARKLGIRTIYCENGYLPGTMQMDVEGVNFYSSFTPRIRAQEYRSFDGDDAALETTLELLRTGQRIPGMIPFPQPKASTGQRLQRELGRLLKPQAWRWLDTLDRSDFRTRKWTGEQPFVLLPLQVVRDSQLSVHSPLLGHDLPRLILHTWLAMRRVLPDHRLVVKLHPKETTHGNRAYLKLASELPDIVFVRGQAMHELLRRCSLVVTINSTVGVEAMAFDKPVVALGRNFYTFPELVQTVADLDELPVAMQAALQRPKDPALRRDFLRYLQQQVLSLCSYRDQSERSLSVACERMLELAKRIQ